MRKHQIYNILTFYIVISIISILLSIDLKEKENGQSKNTSNCPSLYTEALNYRIFYGLILSMYNHLLLVILTL